MPFLKPAAASLAHICTCPYATFGTILGNLKRTLEFCFEFGEAFPLPDTIGLVQYIHPSIGEVTIFL